MKSRERISFTLPGEAETLLFLRALRRGGELHYVESLNKWRKHAYLNVRRVLIRAEYPTCNLPLVQGS